MSPPDISEDGLPEPRHIDGLAELMQHGTVDHSYVVWDDNLENVTWHDPDDLGVPDRVVYVQVDPDGKTATVVTQGHAIAIELT